MSEAYRFSPDAVRLVVSIMATWQCDQIMKLITLRAAAELPAYAREIEKIEKRMASIDAALASLQTLGSL